MTNMEFDLEERVTRYASAMRGFLKKFSLTMMDRSDVEQLLRSSGSVGANYVEANDAISKKDFYHRLRIARKEAKETIYWLRIIDSGSDKAVLEEKAALMDETIQLVRIFSAILRRSEAV